MTIIVAILVILAVTMGMILLARAAFGSRGGVGYFRRQYRAFYDGRGTGDGGSRSGFARVKCPSCGHVNSPDGGYCGRCGKAIRESQFESEGVDDGE